MLTTTPASTARQLDEILEQVGGVLDIGEDLYEIAVREYQAVGQHLARPASRIARYSPQIYPQGSFVLGTMILPLLDGCEYDVDSVVTLNLAKESITQEQLKQLVGDELVLAYAKVLKECRRCWSLKFEKRFHLDVLPSIPDLELGGTAILLTDTDLLRWQHSNPKAYARWFQGRMATVLAEIKKSMALKLRASIDEIPDWRVRTPLQRVVQLLKRHRDLFFREDLDHRPASIVLTTLAAQCYKGQISVTDALISAVDLMPRLAAPREGTYQILNPVNPLENFADKWNEDPALARRFFRWTAAVKEDVATWTSATGGVMKLSTPMSSAFGESIIQKALVRHGQSMAKNRAAGVLGMAVGTGTLVERMTPTPRAVPVRSHTFYGDDSVG